MPIVPFALQDSQISGKFDEGWLLVDIGVAVLKEKIFRTGGGGGPEGIEETCMGFGVGFPGFGP